MSETAAAPVSADAAPAAPETDVTQTDVAQPDPEPWKKAKHRVKVDGREMELDYDELLKGYQTNKAADDRFRKASETEKQMAAFLMDVKANPSRWLEFAEQTGIYDKVLSEAEQRLVRKYELEVLKAQDPEKYELVLAKEERDRLKNAVTQREEAERQKKTQEELASFGQEIETEIIQSLQEQGVKPTPRTIARAAEYLLASLDRPNGRMKASEAFQRVRKDYAADLNEYMQGISDDALASFLGDDVRKRIRSHEIKQVRSQVPSAGGSRPTQPSEKPAPRNERPNVDDWFKKREEFFRKK